MSTTSTSPTPKPQLTTRAKDLLNRYPRLCAMWEGRSQIADYSPSGQDRALLTEAHRHGADENDLVSMLMTRRGGSLAAQGEEHVRGVVQRYIADPVRTPSSKGPSPALNLQALAARLSAIDARLAAIEPMLAAIHGRLPRS